MNMKRFLKAGLFLCIMAAPAFAHASGDPVAIGITPGRLSSMIGAVVGLISIISGGLALRPSARVRFKKREATIALVGGLICIVLSIVHLARATGDFGTGSGKLGAIVAIVLGITGMVLGRIAMVRYRKMVKDSNNQLSN
jgi:hypothetical protein